MLMKATEIRCMAFLRMNSYVDHPFAVRTLRLRDWVKRQTDIYFDISITLYRLPGLTMPNAPRFAFNQVRAVLSMTPISVSTGK